MFVIGDQVLTGLQQQETLDAVIKSQLSVNRDRDTVRPSSSVRGALGFRKLSRQPFRNIKHELCHSFSHSSVGATCHAGC
jgi:hypothetical protein